MNPHDIPEDPIIRNMERTGYPDGKEPSFPRCPVCGEETDTFYKNNDGDIVGCDNCISTVDAWDETANERGRE